MDLIEKVSKFIKYWYFRYLMVTELYMVESWERLVLTLPLLAQVDQRVAVVAGNLLEYLDNKIDYRCLMTHYFDNWPYGTGLMASVNELVMINVTKPRREEGKPSAGTWPTPVEMHQGDHWLNVPCEGLEQQDSSTNPMLSRG